MDHQQTAKVQKALRNLTKHYNANSKLAGATQVKPILNTLQLLHRLIHDNISKQGLATRTKNYES